MRFSCRSQPTVPSSTADRCGDGARPGKGSQSGPRDRLPPATDGERVQRGDVGDHAVPTGTRRPRARWRSHGTPRQCRTRYPSLATPETLGPGLGPNDQPSTGPTSGPPHRKITIYGFEYQSVDDRITPRNNPTSVISTPEQHRSGFSKIPRLGSIRGVIYPGSSSSLKRHGGLFGRRCSAEQLRRPPRSTAATRRPGKVPHSEWPHQVSAPLLMPSPTRCTRTLTWPRVDISSVVALALTASDEREYERTTPVVLPRSVDLTESSQRVPQPMTTSRSRAPMCHPPLCRLSHPASLT